MGAWIHADKALILIRCFTGAMTQSVLSRNSWGMPEPEIVDFTLTGSDAHSHTFISVIGGKPRHCVSCKFLSTRGLEYQSHALLMHLEDSCLWTADKKKEKKKVVLQIVTLHLHPHPLLFFLPIYRVTLPLYLLSSFLLATPHNSPRTFWAVLLSIFQATRRINIHALACLTEAKVKPLKF